MKGIHKMFGLGKTDAVTEASAILDELTRLSAGIAAELEGIGRLNREKAGAESQLADVIGAESGGESAAAEKARRRIADSRLALEKGHEHLTALRGRYVKLVSQLPGLHQDLSDSLPKREAELIEALTEEWTAAAAALARVSAKRKGVERVLGRRLSLSVAELPEPPVADVSPSHSAMQEIRTRLGRLESDGVLTALLTDAFPPPDTALEIVRAAKHALESWDWMKDCERRGQRA